MSPPKALVEASASSRKSRVISKIREAMELMELEIKENQGEYIAGRLSLNEVCRRAGVHPITMQGPAHKATTKPMVLAWLSSLKASNSLAGRGAVEREKKQVRSAEEEVRQLASNFQLRENEFARLREENESLKSRVSELEEECIGLQAIISNGVVAKITSKKPRCAK